MNNAEFWEIVDSAHADGEVNVDGRVESLHRRLRRLPPPEIQSFQTHYDAAVKWAYRWDLWGAAVIMNGQISADGFRYFLDWLVSAGSITYGRALQSPDTLADLMPVAYAESELFGFVALSVFEGRTNELFELDGTVETWPPAGTEWSEQELPLRLPRLSKLYKEWDWLQQIRRGGIWVDILPLKTEADVPPNASDQFPPGE